MTLERFQIDFALRSTTLLPQTGCPGRVWLMQDKDHWFIVSMQENKVSNLEIQSIDMSQYPDVHPIKQDQIEASASIEMISIQFEVSTNIQLKGICCRSHLTFVISHLSFASSHKILVPRGWTHI